MNISSVRANSNKLGCQSQKGTFDQVPNVSVSICAGSPEHHHPWCFWNHLLLFAATLLKNSKAEQVLWEGSWRESTWPNSTPKLIVETNAFRPVLQAVIFYYQRSIGCCSSPSSLNEWYKSMHPNILSYELLVGSIFCHRICSGIKRYTFVEVYGYTLWNIVVTRTQTD